MSNSENVSAGVFLLIAMFLLAGGILLIGQERQIFSSQSEYHVEFKNVRGLSEGAPVRLGGISIGRVSKIGFSNDLKDLNVHVTMLINEDYLSRIRKDSSVSILTQGLLGDKYVSLNNGMADEILSPGSRLKSEESGSIAEVLEKAGKVVDTTVEISDNVNAFLVEFREKTLDEFTRAFSGLADISEEIKNGKGFLHKIVYSEKEGGKILENLEAASKNLGEITQEVKKGDGLLNALIYDDSGKKTISTLTTAAGNLAETAEHISEIAAEIKQGNGLLHGLVYDDAPEGLDDLIAKLNRTAENLEKTSKALSSGSGTIGALLVDSALYDNLVEVTEGAKRSFILRQAIRRSLNK